MTIVMIIADDCSERHFKMWRPFQFGSTEVCETGAVHARVLIGMEGAAQNDLFVLADGTPRDASSEKSTHSLSGIKAPKRVADQGWTGRARIARRARVWPQHKRLNGHQHTTDIDQIVFA